MFHSYYQATSSRDVLQPPSLHSHAGTRAADLGGAWALTFRSRCSFRAKPNSAFEGTTEPKELPKQNSPLFLRARLEQFGRDADGDFLGVSLPGANRSDSERPSVGWPSTPNSRSSVQHAALERCRSRRGKEMSESSKFVHHGFVPLRGPGSSRQRTAFGEFP